MIFAATDIVTGMKFRATLTHNNIPGFYDLTAESLDTQSLRIRVATVSSTTTRFLMSHFSTPDELSRNAGNPDFCVILTMPHLFHMVLTSSEFNDLDFFMSAL